MKITSDISVEHKLVREHCGFFFLDDWVLVSASGKDTFSFLQTQTTNDVPILEIGKGHNNAIVDRKARLLAAFSLHKTSDESAMILVPESLKDSLIKQLESFRFREDVNFDPQVDQSCLLALQGPKTSMVMESLTGTLQTFQSNDIKKISVGSDEVLAIGKSFTGEDGVVLALDPSIKDKIIAQIKEAGKEFDIEEVGPETREILRVEAGLPLYGKDMDAKHILPETGLEHSSVSYSKGCYIGQEVIARVKTYGSPSFALMGITIEGDSIPPLNTEIKMGSKKIGSVKSSVHSLSLGKTIALTYIQKDFRSPDQELEVTLGDSERKIKTVLLPFYQASSTADRAKELHEQALKIYKTEDKLDRPITLLREAIALDPKFAIAYEALGVFLSKQNKLDEAISLMKRLAEIDPSGIMAHTNLSIYYMKQGRIEDAEKEKAEAIGLEFENMIQKSADDKSKADQAKMDKEEQEKKVEMFLKVLEIDSADEVANFGLGSIYLKLDRYEDALKHLQIVVENNKDYSAAYLLLGKTWENLSNKENAAEVYRDGIAAASRKGDLMPLRDMQNRLNQISQSGA